MSNKDINAPSDVLAQEDDPLLALDRQIEEELDKLMKLISGPGFYLMSLFLKEHSRTNNVHNKFQIRDAHMISPQTLINIRMSRCRHRMLRRVR